MTLDDLNLIELQPAFLREDPSTRAVCNALGPIFLLLGEEIKNILIYTSIDGLDGPVLDELAYGWGVSWYRSADTVESRRATVKSALKVFMSMGTAGAVTEAARSVFGEARLEEWFEYGGQPGYFKLTVNLFSSGFEQGEHLKLLRRIEIYKNVRSRLESVDYQIRAPEAVLRVGAAQRWGQHLTVLPYQPDPVIGTPAVLHVGAASVFSQFLKVRPKGEEV